MFVLVGLGNPEKRFESTRHNIGFEVIDYIARKNGLKLDKLRHKALYQEMNVGGKKVLIVKPQTYMNLSGDSVISLVNYFKVEMSNLAVIYDDIDLPLGDLRIRKSGSAGTHNGMRDIIYKLKRDDFPRFRIGVGKNARMDLKDFVLSRFSKSEIPLMEEAVMKTEEALMEYINNGIDSAMNKYNLRKTDKSE